MRRILLVAGFAAVSIAIAVALWFFFFRAPGTTRPRTNAPAAATNQPVANTGTPLTPAADFTSDSERFSAPDASPFANGGLTVAALVSPTPTLGAEKTTDGLGVRYYDETSGQFFSTDSSGTAQPMSDKRFANVERLAWAPDADKAILEFPDGSNVLFDFTNQKQTSLPKHWEELTFAPDGSQIIGKSIGVDPTNRWLLTANSDGSGAIPVQELGDNADKVTVAVSPAGHAIAFAKTGEPQGFGRQEILLIGKKKENFKSLVVEGLNFQGQWSPDGNRILYSAVSPADNYQPSLWIVDGGPSTIGNNRRKLQVSTWADKCVFADTTRLYCAVPQTLQEGAGLARETSSNVADELWTIDLTSGTRRRIAQTDTASNMSNLVLSTDGSTLTFTDSGTGALRQIRLTP